MRSIGQKIGSFCLIVAHLQCKKRKAMSIDTFMVVLCTALIVGFLTFFVGYALVGGGDDGDCV